MRKFFVGILMALITVQVSSMEPTGGEQAKSNKSWHRWTEEECEKLKEGVKANGKNFGSIRKNYLPTRTKQEIKSKYYHDSCKKQKQKLPTQQDVRKYQENNNILFHMSIDTVPSNIIASGGSQIQIAKSGCKKSYDSWTDEECKKLELGVNECGKKWKQIRECYFPTRSRLEIISKYYNERRKSDEHLDAVPSGIIANADIPTQDQLKQQDIKNNDTLFSSSCEKHKHVDHQPTLEKKQLLNNSSENGFDGLLSFLNSSKEKEK